jgi:hypothetical protein
MRTAEEIEETRVVKRVSPREEMSVNPQSIKDDDPMARASRRAAELRGHVGSFDEGVDKFATPPAPPGWTYEWKRRLVMGFEDHSYMSSLVRMGWEPVPSSRHPEMMPKGYEGSIEREGQILMERPEEITKEIRDLELKKARQQVNIKAGQIDPKGQGGLMTRDDANASMSIKKGYSPIAIPD